MQANQAACAMYGYSREELLALTNADLSAEPALTQKVTQETPPILDRVISIPLRWHRRRNGDRFPVEITGRFFVRRDRPVHIAAIRDITKRHRNEAIIRMHLELIEFAASHSLDQVLQKSLDQVSELTDSCIGFYHFVEDEQRALSLQAWSTRTLQEFCTAEGEGQHYPIEAAGVWADAVRDGKPIIHNDYASLPHRKGMPEGHAHVIRELVVPILRRGAAVAALGVGNKPTDYTPEDIETVAYFADLAWEIAERRRAEDELRDSEERFRSVVESAPHAIFIQTQQRFAYVNPAAIALFGAADDTDLLGVPVIDRFHPEDREKVAERIQRLNDERQAVPLITERILRMDGATVHVDVSAVPFTYQGRQGALVFAQDVTQRVTAEAERAQFLAQIQAQAQQIRQIMDTVPEGVLLINVAGDVLLANATGQRQLAALAGVIVGDRITHLGDLPLSTLLRPPASDTWQEVQHGTRSFEVIARPVASGQEPADLSYAEHWVMVMNDVTRARDLQQQFEHQNRLAAVGQLAAGIAHDFNNILAVIALQAPMLARTPGLTERDHQRLRVIQEQVNRAAQLIQQILDFSRRAILERRPLDLGAFLGEQVELLARTLPESIEVRLSREPGEHTVLADPTRMQQMVMNLAFNARDAMPKGGRLHLTLERLPTPPRPDLKEGQWVRLTVADSGTGLSPEAQAHLFEPFFTTKPPGQSSGLGLAQVHGIVKQHGGEIEADSVTGQGVTFTIYLPAVAPPTPARLPASPHAQPDGQGTILLVEDNPDLLTVMSDLMDMMGYRTFCAKNGAEALTVLEAEGEAIDLVLTDLVMPVMSGDDLLIALRERGLTMPVVILSVHPLEGELTHLRSKGLTAWLTKPPDLDELERLLTESLAARRKSQAGEAATKPSQLSDPVAAGSQ